ncbi:hypothetical protein [Nitrosomonas communis]|uniref:Uncharacterized protein n=1 Tax=Nitrosomonas communis TaxID=44574 RepID=A0A1H2ZRD3_9PROT|nr:hypothetical protein [Nitrosomonas communis]SDX19937.1 hypothetical protein SAMN05421882_10893 [Nitrosomonas communis]
MTSMLKIICIWLIAITLPLLWKISDVALTATSNPKKIEIFSTRINKDFSATMHGLVGNYFSN